jgi:class 3 adenylate cyclase
MPSAGALRHLCTFLLDYPEGLQAFLEYIGKARGTGRSLRMWAPSHRDDPALKQWWGRFERLGASPAAGHRVLATVLFTDIVGSTARAEQLGDQRWRNLLEAHHTTMRRELARFRGNKVRSLGDGFLATFDGPAPARAVRCACSIAEAVRALDIQVRSGLHTGEIEVAGDDVQGIAVHIAMRVSALAGPGEVLVSRTVKDLVAGSGLRFHERGRHSLKGLQEPLDLYAALNRRREQRPS